MTGNPPLFVLVWLSIEFVYTISSCWQWGFFDWPVTWAASLVKLHSSGFALLHDALSSPGSGGYGCHKSLLWPKLPIIMAQWSLSVMTAMFSTKIALTQEHWCSQNAVICSHLLFLYNRTVLRLSVLTPSKPCIAISGITLTWQQEVSHLNHSRLEAAECKHEFCSQRFVSCWMSCTAVTLKQLTTALHCTPAVLFLDKPTAFFS